MNATGIQTELQAGDILLISIHAVLTAHQSKSLERGDSFDIGYNAKRYGERIDSNIGGNPFFKINKERHLKWISLIESVMTDDQKNKYEEMPDEFKPEGDNF